MHSGVFDFSGGTMSDRNCDVFVMQFVSLIVWTIFRAIYGWKCVRYYFI